MGFPSRNVGHRRAFVRAFSCTAQRNKKAPCGHVAKRLSSLQANIEELPRNEGEGERVQNSFDAFTVEHLYRLCRNSFHRKQSRFATCSLTREGFCKSRFWATDGFATVSDTTSDDRWSPLQTKVVAFSYVDRRNLGVTVKFCILHFAFCIYLANMPKIKLILIDNGANLWYNVR